MMVIALMVFRKAVVGFFEEDIPGFLKTGDSIWEKELEAADSSDRSWKAIDANTATYSTESPL